MAATERLRILGEVVLGAPADLKGVVLRVALLDVSMADAPALELTASERNVEGKGLQRVPFELELATPPIGRRYALTGEIRKLGRDRPQAGDYLNTVAVPWSPDKRRTRWAIPLQRLDA
jgi:uncharacterized lipoprotein YbaY